MLPPIASVFCRDAQVKISALCPPFATENAVVTRRVHQDESFAHSFAHALNLVRQFIDRLRIPAHFHNR
jgi:hypothetical protein